MLLSQYIEERYAAELLVTQTSGIGYLLKQRVADIEECGEVLRRVATGGTALDPEVVTQLLVRHDRDPLDRPTPREPEVLELMASGRSNSGIAARLVASEPPPTTSSPNWTCRKPIPTTAGYSRYCATSARGEARTCRKP